ncbi:hypothetical protein D3C86_1269620 [compost metagenome]
MPAPACQVLGCERLEGGHGGHLLDQAGVGLAPSLGRALEGGLPPGPEHLDEQDQGHGEARDHEAEAPVVVEQEPDRDRQHDPIEQGADRSVSKEGSEPLDLRHARGNVADATGGEEAHG